MRSPTSAHARLRPRCSEWARERHFGDRQAPSARGVMRQPGAIGTVGELSDAERNGTRRPQTSHGSGLGKPRNDPAGPAARLRSDRSIFTASSAAPAEDVGKLRTADGRDFVSYGARLLARAGWPLRRRPSVPVVFGRAAEAKAWAPSLYAKGCSASLGRLWLGWTS